MANVGPEQKRKTKQNKTSLYNNINKIRPSAPCSKKFGLQPLAPNLRPVPSAQVNTVKRKPLRTGGWSMSAQEFRAAHEVNKLPPQLTPQKVIHRIHNMP